MEEGYLGEVRIFAGDFPPKFWAYCEGGVLQVSTNNALYALLGNRFGGTSPRTFALPRIPDPGPGMKYVVCVAGIFPNRSD